MDKEDKDLLIYSHDWRYVKNKTTPSGKILYRCARCGIEDPAPVKIQYEHRKCIERNDVDIVGTLSLEEMRNFLDHIIEKKKGEIHV
jgi:hypothetical protein